MGDQDMELSSDRSGAAAEQALIVRFGMAMTIAGESIDEVGERLTQLADARGVRDISVVVLPTALFVQTAEAGTVRVQLDAFPNRQLRLDQIGDLYDLLHRAECAVLVAPEPRDGRKGGGAA